jgi:hypothetical protein
MTPHSQHREEYYALISIRTRNSSNEAAADLRLRLHDQRDLHFAALQTLESQLDMSDAPKLGMRLRVFLPTSSTVSVSAIQFSTTSSSAIWEYWIGISWDVEVGYVFDSVYINNPTNSVMENCKKNTVFSIIACQSCRPCFEQIKITSIEIRVQLLEAEC